MDTFARDVARGVRQVWVGHVPSIFLQRKAEAYASGMEYNAMENAAG